MLPHSVGISKMDSEENKESFDMDNISVINGKISSPCMRVNSLESKNGSYRFIGRTHTKKPN